MKSDGGSGPLMSRQPVEAARFNVQVPNPAGGIREDELWRKRFSPAHLQERVFYWTKRHGETTGIHEGAAVSRVWAGISARGAACV